MTAPNRGTGVGWLMAAMVMLVLSVAELRVHAAPERPGGHSGGQDSSGSPPWARAEVLGVGGSHIGISVGDLEDSGLSDLEAAEGAVVQDVQPDSPAQTAGLERGDVIVQYDGERVRGARQLARLVQETPAGRTVAATVMRDGSRVEVELVPAAGSAWRARLERPLQQVERRFRELHRSFSPGAVRLGVDVMPLTPQLADYFGVETGVLVTNVDEPSPAAAVGLQAGDVIIRFDGEAVDDVADLRRAVARVAEDGPFTVDVIRERDPASLNGRLSDEAARPPAGRAI